MADKNWKKVTWKDIAGWEGLYQVSNFGAIKSLAKEWKGGQGCKGSHPDMIMKLSPNTRGYPSICLCSGNNKRTYKVHRLVLEAFVGKSDLQVNHKNGNKFDNRLENLEYCTGSENIQHAYRNGLNHGPRGKAQHLVRLTEAQVIRIKFIAKNYIHVHGYWVKLSKALNIDSCTIQDIIHNRTWKYIEV